MPELKIRGKSGAVNAVRRLSFNRRKKTHHGSAQCVSFLHQRICPSAQCLIIVHQAFRDASSRVLAASSSPASCS
ncbi:hypothetical protein EcCFBP13530_00710 [Enterobacter cancerogenus]|uniref:Uncharacterized protein n=1 Tax=Enterobacter cancerogenus TaxID=69218 RepID=A0AB38P7W4_9ENTR|nr:hypothetical protein EcCFBP13530_00710 [Enterobacter cancerogenus]